jgi:hypothetical protein
VNPGRSRSRSRSRSHESRTSDGRTFFVLSAEIGMTGSGGLQEVPRQAGGVVTVV